MTRLTLTCQVCAQLFEASRRDARYCRPRCQRLASRRRASGELGLIVRGLQGQVLHELERAARADTVNGQLALQLVDAMTATDATGVASLSRELRTVMTLALAGSSAAPGDSSATVDQLARVRAARDRKAHGTSEPGDLS